ncbi:hypothetical protein ACFPM3_30610 [Streptomyces coeruleoprunus]|uniref:Uncharacterized protein n=1 Tax=Streptomyces coeruleoprunus TaxID=285563 RepID=A0ABV9XN03_9ACTN
MAVYDLTHIPAGERCRWLAQHCPDHAASPGVADLVAPEWETFDPWHHQQHIHCRLSSTRTTAASPRPPRAHT